VLKQVLSRRHFLQIAGVTSVSAVIAACAPAATPAPTEAPKAESKAEATKVPEATKAPEGKKKISISHIGGTSQDASDKSYKTKLFREAFPDIEIENRWIGYGAYVDKMPLMVASGDIADIQFCNAFNDIPLMVEAKILTQCDDLLQKAGQDILACTPKEAWDSTIYDNKQMAMTHNTYNLNVWGIYYRKDWMDKIGLTKVPETIDEYGEALIAFTEKDPDGDGQANTWGRSPFNSLKFDDDVYHAFGAAVGHHANGFWRKRGDAIALDWINEGIKEAVAWFAKMYKAGAIEPDGITAPIETWGTKWTGGQLGSQYTSYGGLDGTARELRKTAPNAAIVPGPAVKGPRGDQGFTGEGWPWCFVLSAKCQYPEDAMRMTNWFFVPETLSKTICQGELGITNKGLNDKGWCDEYSLEEIDKMGQAYSDKVKEVSDLTYFGGVWNTAQTDLVPTILAHMPADMKTHFEGVLAKRMSPAAIQGRDFATKYLRLTAKKRPAPSEKTIWPALQTRFLEFLSQGATGTIDLDQGWKDWLDFFEKNGGPTLTEEINAM
jgi:ABC-type glycerol-3-phosphate transport system substrate-binding protein